MELELFYTFIIGLCVGSFLNVAIYRMPRGISVVSPHRSFCTTCNRTLEWYENVPVLSWLFLGGKCRGCKETISGQYPLVELLAAFAAVVSYLQFGLTPSSVVITCVLWALIVVSFIDLEFRIIPDRISCTGGILGLGLGVVSQYTEWFRCDPYSFCPITQNSMDSALGVLLGSGFFFLIERAYWYITKREGLGYGDIKLMALTGATLGAASIPPTIFAGSLIGSIVGIGAMIVTKQGRQTEIPFGPWLALGAVLYIFFELPFFQFFR